MALYAYRRLLGRGCGYFPEDLELRLSPTKGEMESDSECVEKFYVYLRECSSVFFAGGDQNKYADCSVAKLNWRFFTYNYIPYFQTCTELLIYLTRLLV